MVEFSPRLTGGPTPRMVAMVLWLLALVLDLSSTDALAKNVGGTLSGSNFWVAADSPVHFLTDLTIVEGATLSVGPGTVVQGDGYGLYVAGTLLVSGTEFDPVRFSQLSLYAGYASSGGARPTRAARIEIVRAQFEGGQGLGVGGNHLAGDRIVLRESVFRGVGRHQVSYPSDCLIERNRFERCEGVSTGHGDLGNVRVLNNLFLEAATHGGRVFAVESWAAAAARPTVVMLNTFTATNQVAVSLEPGATKAYLSAVSNYWSTLDEAAVGGMIYDRTDTSTANATIAFRPLLSAPDPRTPRVDRLPSIVRQPESALVGSGGAVTLAAECFALDPTRYRWLWNGEELPQATNAVLTLTNVTLADAGDYVLVATNDFGTVTTAAATLHVAPADGTPVIAVNGRVGPRLEFTNAATVEVQIVSSLARPTIFYDLTGASPDFQDPVYAGAFALATNADLRVAAYGSDFERRDGTPTAVVFWDEVTVASQGEGSVKGIGSEAFYLRGTRLALEAQPAPGWEFVSWGGSLESTNAVLEVSVQGTLSFAAVFRQKPVHSLKAFAVGGGTVTGQKEEPYLSGEVARLTAVPKAGWSFLRWAGDVTGDKPNLEVSVDHDLEAEAVFGTTLTTSVRGAGAIQIVPRLDYYPYGTRVSAVALPETGHGLALWGADGSGNANPYSLQVTNAAVRLSALFAPLGADEVVLAVVVNGQGTVSQDVLGSLFPRGQTVVLTAAAAADKTNRFLFWGSEEPSTTNPLVVTLDRSRLLVANFSDGSFPLVLLQPTATKGGGIRFSVSGLPGENVVIEAAAGLTNWSAQVTNQIGANGRLGFQRDSVVPPGFFRARAGDSSKP